MLKQTICTDGLTHSGHYRLIQRGLLRLSADVSHISFTQHILGHVAETMVDGTSIQSRDMGQMAIHMCMPGPPPTTLDIRDHER